MTIAQTIAQQTNEIASLKAEIDRRDREAKSFFGHVISGLRSEFERRMEDMQAQLDAAKSSARFAWEEHKRLASIVGEPGAPEAESEARWAAPPPAAAKALAGEPVDKPVSAMSDAELLAKLNEPRLPTMDDPKVWRLTVVDPPADTEAKAA